MQLQDFAGHYHMPSLQAGSIILQVSSVDADLHLIFPAVRY